MAQEKPRASRAKTTKTKTTKTKTAEGTGVEKPATARSRRAAAPRDGTAKPGTAVTSAAEQAAPAPKRATRRKVAARPRAEQVAERAYLLWEQGEPGDATEHWLRAEAELRTAA